MSEEDVTQLSKTSDEGLVFEKTEDGWKCPECGTVVPFFITRKYAQSARCPACGAKFVRHLVPKEAVKSVPKHIYEMAGKQTLDEILDAIEVSEGKKPEEPKAMPKPEKPEEKGEELMPKAPEKEREELFERPKHPCEILQEICEEFGLKDTFTSWMVRRCERMGGLHPVEFYHFLKTMKSGVKTEQEAAFIAEEYAYALQREQEKAQRQGMPFFIPSPSIVSSESSPYLQRLMQVSSSTQVSQFEQTPSMHVQRQTPQIQRYQHQLAQPYQPIQYQPIQQGFVQSFTARDMIELIKTTKDLTKPEVDPSALAQIIAQTVSQTLAPILEKIADKGKSVDIDVIKELAETKARLSYKDEIIELYKKQVETAEKREKETLSAVKDIVDKMLKEWKEEREYFVKKIEAVRPSEFSTDEARLVATGLQKIAQVGEKLIDALDRRQPIKVIVESLPNLMGASSEAAKPKPEKYKESTTSSDITEILKKEGLVEE